MKIIDIRMRPPFKPYLGKNNMFDTEDSFNRRSFQGNGSSWRSDWCSINSKKSKWF